MSQNTPINELQAALESAKAATQAARTEHGAQSEQAKEAKKAQDRIYQALRRAERSASTNQAKAPAPAANTQEDATVATETPAKPKGQATKDKPAAKGGDKPKAAPKPRKANGEPVRASRKNRQTGTKITVLDTSLQSTYKVGDKTLTFDTEKGRWALISEETAESAQYASFAEACLLARTPAEWGKKEAALLKKREAEAAKAAAEKAAK